MDKEKVGLDRYIKIEHEGELYSVMVQEHYESAFSEAAHDIAIMMYITKLKPIKFLGFKFNIWEWHYDYIVGTLAFYRTPLGCGLEKLNTVNSNFHHPLKDSDGNEYFYRDTVVKWFKDALRRRYWSMKEEEDKIEKPKTKFVKSIKI